MDLELDPIRQSRGSSKPGQPHRILGITSATRIWQNEKMLPIDKIENIRERVAGAGKVGPAQCYRYDFCATGDKRVPHDLVRRELSRTEEQAGSEFVLRNFEFRGLVRHAYKHIRNQARCECSCTTAIFA